MAGKKMKVIVLLAIPVLILGFLAFQGFKNSAAYYYSVAEVSAMELTQNKLRIKGELVKDSVDYDAQSPLLKFSLVEEGHLLPVIYNGVMPDNFTHADEIIVEGKLEASGQFQVSKLMLQCPSKYEGEE